MAVIVREKVKGSDEWWVFVNHKGKRVSKKVGSRKAAKKLALEMETRLAKGDLGWLDKRPTLKEYGEKWLTSPLHEWSDTTRIEYETIFRLHILPQLGSKRLDQLKMAELKAHLAALNGLSRARKKAILAVISGILGSAVEDELIQVNPCIRMGKYTNGDIKPKEINPLTAQEVVTFLENAAKLSLVEYTFYLVAVRTGMRPGELLGLIWKDFNEEHRYLNVTKQWNDRLKRNTRTKNKKSRKVNLSPQATEALKALRHHRAKVVGIQSKALIFETDKGKRLDYGWMGKLVKTIAPRGTCLKDATRHTYATLRIAKGDNIVDVSRQLGHHSVAFTLKTYVHWVPEIHKHQVDDLDTMHLDTPQLHPASENSHH